MLAVVVLWALRVQIVETEEVTAAQRIVVALVAEAVGHMLAVLVVAAVWRYTAQLVGARLQADLREGKLVGYFLKDSCFFRHLVFFESKCNLMK